MLIFSCMSFLYSVPIPCTHDKDCFIKNRPDIHTSYCVNNICSKLLPPAEHCTMPQQCASYSFYGPIACSAQCKVENECMISKFIESTYCCLPIPENKRCNPNRPSQLSGCDIKQSCVFKNNHYLCSYESSNSKWIIGAILSILGNVLINTGVNIQKLSYTKNNIKIFLHNFDTFNIGMIIYIVGKLSGYLSYIFGNQSLLAVLSATGLVSNSILAPLINDEIFTYKDLAAIFFVFTGTTFIIFNTKVSHKSYSLCELLKLYHKPSIILYFFTILFFIIFLYWFIRYVETNSRFNEDNNRLFYSENVYFDDDGYIIKYFMVLMYVLLSSFIASFTTLCIKSLAEIIDKTISEENQFKYFVTYVFIGGLVLCTFGQIYWLNRGLKRYDALLVVPIFHITWSILSIVTAGIYFQEFEHYDWSQFRNFFIGLGIIFIGSMFLSTRIINKNSLTSKEEKID
ncbi:putative magnesium transporter [Vairimorpha necatrix]|uniref:Magnesium transporter n=1 Tax=Vairimorpha necatrix TaxID=6039 RepID=A0AAX4JFZ7_9MICR